MSTTITVTVTKQTANLPSGKSFGGTNVVVKDNSGVTLTGVMLTGKETPPWTAVFTGAAGPNEAEATVTDLDTTGAAIGTPIVVTESGSGGIPPTFPQSTGVTITVTGS